MNKEALYSPSPCFTAESHFLFTRHLLPPSHISEAKVREIERPILNSISTQAIDAMDSISDTVFNWSPHIKEREKSSL